MGVIDLEESELVWQDGKLVPWRSASTHVLTHSLHYGVAAFEGIRAYKARKGTAIFRLNDHLKRFFNSAKIYRLKLRFSTHELHDACKQVVRKNKLQEAYVRPIAFLGYGKMGVAAAGVPVHTAIAAFKFGSYLGERAQEKGVRCKISSWCRIDPRILPTRAKISGNYANSILASAEARELGFDEAILLNVHGFVAEGPGENIFMVKDGALITPPLSAGILPGITRGTVMRLAADQGLTVLERDVTRDELYVADEAFFTGTATQVAPIREVDRITIADGQPGQVTKKLRKEYMDVVHGRNPKYRAWLEYV